MVMMEIEQMSDFGNFPSFDLNSSLTLLKCKYLDIVNVSSYDWKNALSISLFNIRSCKIIFLDFSCYFNDIFSSFSSIIIVETWHTNEYANAFMLNGLRTFDIAPYKLWRWSAAICKE